MRDVVKRKLAAIQELYPPERIEKSKERWRRLWQGEAPLDRLPFVASPVTIPYYDSVDTAEERLMRSLDEFLYRGIFQDDFIPALFPGCRQATIPNLFGAQEIVMGNDHGCERLVNTAEEVAALPEPTIRPGSIAQEWLDMQAYFVEETEGQLPVHVVDMQGPVDVAAQLWGYDNLLAAAYLEPDAYDRLLSLTSEAFLLFWKAQEKTIGPENFVGTHLFGWDWVPPGTGATLSADSMVMVSADYYREFYEPYHLRIGEALGGLTIHSCGDFSKMIPALNNTRCLRGVNAGQMTVAQLVEGGLDKRLVLIANSSMEEAPALFEQIGRENLRADVSVQPWPANERAFRPWEWTKEDRLEIKRNEELLLRLAFQFGKK